MHTGKPSKDAVAALVVVGTSARLLAECARAGGFEVHALDVFGDADTLRLAHSWQSIRVDGRLAIDGAALEAALRRFAAAGRVQGWIAGSGLEAAPDLLARAAACLPLLGNDAATVAQLRTPADFHSTLGRLGIRAPQVRLAMPPEPAGWLFKDAHACGGWHVRAARRAPAVIGAGGHFQRFQSGTPMSALFVADARRWQLVMLSLQLVGAPAPRRYAHRGNLGPVTLGAQPWAQLCHALDALVPAYGLRGINGLDFLLDGDELWVLEINPRPTASLALLDASAQVALLRQQVALSRGASVGAAVLAPAAPGVRASEVVFARAGGEVSAAAAATLAGFGFCRDLPAAGAKFAKGDPVCTVLAAAEDCAAALAALQARRDAVLACVQAEVAPA